MDLLPSVRSSDSDREHVAERLRHATSEGRLTRSELEERLEALYASRTYGELEALVADLPVTQSPSHPNFAFLRWAAVLGAVTLLLGVLAMLALDRRRSAVGVIPLAHLRRLNLPGGFPDPHQGLIVAASTGAAVVVLVAAAVLLWVLMRSRPRQSP